MSTEFEIRDYQPEDESSVLALVQRGMGGGPTGTRDEIFWRWKHLDNPFGRSLGLVATNHAGQLVGLRIFMRWRFTTGNTTVRAVRAVDTVTHPEYRRYGVFSALTNKAVEQAKNEGVDLIFNTPNNQVLPGYLKLGWNYVSAIRPLVKVLNYPRFVAGLLRSRNKRQSSQQLSGEQIFRHRPTSMEEFLSHSEALEELLHHHNQKRDGNLFTDQSLNYLRWRYSEYPYANYAVLPQEKDGKISGIIIMRPNARFGLKEAVLDELLLHTPDEDLAFSLLNDMKRYVSADYIIAYFPHGSFERHILRRYGFHQVPRDSMNFTVNVLSSHLPCNPIILENWGLSLGDLEIF